MQFSAKLLRYSNELSDAAHFKFDGDEVVEEIQRKVKQEAKRQRCRLAKSQKSKSGVSQWRKAGKSR